MRWPLDIERLPLAADMYMLDLNKLQRRAFIDAVQTRVEVELRTEGTFTGVEALRATRDMWKLVAEEREGDSEHRVRDAQLCAMLQHTCRTLRVSLLFLVDMMRLARRLFPDTDDD